MIDIILIILIIAVFAVGYYAIYRFVRFIRKIDRDRENGDEKDSNGDEITSDFNALERQMIKFGKKK